MTLMSFCHWKTLVPFCLRKKRPKNASLTSCELLQKCREKKTDYAMQNNSKLAI